MTLRILLAFSAIAVLLAACGSGADDDGDATAVATVDPATAFDPNVLTSLVLRTDDLVSPMGGRGTFSPPGGVGVSYTTFYGNDDLFVQSTVGKYSPAERDEQFEHLRRGLAGLVGLESNYPIDGSDAGFKYTSQDIPGITALIFKGDYYLGFTLRSANSTRAPEATDSATLDRYANLVMSRLDQYLSDPTSVTPIPGIPTYQAPPPTPATTPEP